MSNAAAPSVNHWPDSACARAFWGQQDLPPYRRLLADTVCWLDPRPGERWLDLGCGSGQLSRALWEKSGGTLAEVVALDCAAANAGVIDKLRARVRPTPGAGRFRFVHADFSGGLVSWPEGHFDGVVSGLAIQYAESYSPAAGRWTADAYDALLRDVSRVLRAGGRFVFSVNVPEPSWGRVALFGVPGAFRARKPVRFLRQALGMWRYGSWLKREARRGRFHYLPLDAIRAKLARAGFTEIEDRLSFARQAYLLRCRKPG
jgi:SAM-dependent methyltransferase